MEDKENPHMRSKSRPLVDIFFLQCYYALLMPERKQFDPHILREKIAKGRALTMQIEPSLWDYCQKAAASETGCTAKKIAKEGEEFPARIRRSGKVLETVDGSQDGPPKFYQWQTVTNTVCKVKVPYGPMENRIAVAIEHSGGEPGFMRFFQEFDRLKKQALKTPVRVVKTPASQ